MKQCVNESVVDGNVIEHIRSDVREEPCDCSTIWKKIKIVLMVK